MKAEWIAPSETTPVAIKVVKLVSSTQVTVDVTAKKTGTGKIVLIPPIGTPVSADVTVS